jgi:hypothetical protein
MVIPPIEGWGEYGGGSGRSLPQAKRVNLSQMQICVLVSVILELLDWRSKKASGQEPGMPLR